MGDYVTLAEVKEQLGDLGTDYDAYLGHLITRSSRDVDRLTGQFFDIQTGITRKYDGTHSRRLFLGNEWPLIQVTSLSAAWVTTQAQFTIPSTDYFLEPIKRRSGEPARWIELTDWPVVFWWFPQGKQNVWVTGDWGWPAIPDEIKEVTLELVVRSWRQRGAGDSDQAGVTGLDLETVPRALSPRSNAILRKYTSMIFA